MEESHQKSAGSCAVKKEIVMEELDTTTDTTTDTDTITDTITTDTTAAFEGVKMSKAELKDAVYEGAYTAARDVTRERLEDPSFLEEYGFAKSDIGAGIKIVATTAAIAAVTVAAVHVGRKLLSSGDSTPVPEAPDPDVSF